MKLESEDAHLLTEDYPGLGTALQDTKFTHSLEKRAAELSALDVEEAAVHGEETVYIRKLQAVLQSGSLGEEPQEIGRHVNGQIAEQSKPLLLLH